jgi:hypothetical protein
MILGFFLSNKLARFSRHLIVASRKKAEQIVERNSLSLGGIADHICSGVQESTCSAQKFGEEYPRTR